MTQALVPHIKSIALLRASFPNAVLPEETVLAYTAALSDLPEPVVHAACSTLVKRSTFMPTIAEIRGLVAEETLELPSAIDAWTQASSRAIGTWTGQRHPVVTLAMEAVGGAYAIKTSENPIATRAQFRDAYAELRTNARNHFIDTGQAPEMPKPKQIDRLVELGDGTFAIEGAKARENAPAVSQKGISQ